MCAKTGGLLEGRIAVALLALALVSPAAFGARPGDRTGTRRIDFSAREATAPSGLDYQTLPLERSHQNHLLVRALINGKPALLAVDTGAPISVIAINRVAHYGLTPLHIEGEGPLRLMVNDRRRPALLSRVLELGELHLLRQPMVAVDLSNIRRTAYRVGEEPIDGIIGTDILFPTSAILDCRAQELILRMEPELAGSLPLFDYAGYSRIPIQVSSGRSLYVDGNFDGQRGRLRLDTGAFGTLLHDAFVQRLKVPLRKSSITSTGVYRDTRDVDIATINRFSVGPLNLRSQEVGVVNLDGYVHFTRKKGVLPVAGLLGSEILADYNGIIDFGTRTLYLKN